jgi:hypothetical protein
MVKRVTPLWFGSKLVSMLVVEEVAVLWLEVGVGISWVIEEQ